MPDFSLEIGYQNDNCRIIAGVDEVGRGALAGPIVAGAVVFEKYDEIITVLSELNDSKKLSETKRVELDELIKEKSKNYAFGVVSHEEIDQFGIGAANIFAFKRALDRIPNIDLALIDGRRFRGFEYKYHCFEKGESKSLSIAAASIVAKVYRDGVMVEFGKKYPEYDFVSNKGYGSEKHFEVLESIGLSPIHRKSFLNCLEKPNKLF